jgi:hypothetical protein
MELQSRVKNHSKAGAGDQRRGVACAETRSAGWPARRMAMGYTARRRDDAFSGRRPTALGAIIVPTFSIEYQLRFLGATYSRSAKPTANPLSH